MSRPQLESSADMSFPFPLPSSTREILKTCPRFRLLIIGNSGVGKSALIRGVFGIKGVDISGGVRGQADIDQEFVAEENGPFVIHDSLGFEAGEGNNIDEIKRFIEDRRKIKDLKDRLHAVWVCLAIPYAKGRFLEAGTEEFLQNRIKLLGDIPVIVVLTKLDLLDRLLFREYCRPGSVKSLEEARTIIAPYRSKFLDEQCTRPLSEVVTGDIPHVPVSVAKGFGLEPTIPDLIKTTTSLIEQYCEAASPIL